MNRCPQIHSSGERCHKEAGHKGYCQLDPGVHRCHAIGCVKPVPPEMLLCHRHWRMVPKPIQQQVWRHYRPGQCDDKNPSEAWHLAANEAIRAVAQLEGRTRNAR